MNPTNPSQTVLVIDDDPIVRLMAGEALSEAGYTVLEACDAETGWETFDRSGADLILLDVILPGMNGFEACARLRKHPAGQNIPIMVMTGLDDRQSIANAYDSGATDFITKPIVWDLLPYRVRYALRASEAFLETSRSRGLLSRTQSLANMASWEWCRDDDTLAWSAQMECILGTALGPRDAAARTLLLAHVHVDDRSFVECSLVGAMDHGLAYSIEFRVVRQDGTVCQLLEQTHIERLADHTVRAVHGIRRDITEQTEASERIRSLAHFDPLTGLANRSLFRSEIQRRLTHGASQGEHCAVLIVDIDRFKLINETIGPLIGDEVLKSFAHRLRDCLKSSHLEGESSEPPAEATIARLGGDEFTVLLGDLRDPKQANQVAQRISRALSQPMVIGDHELTVVASIGISISPHDGKDTDTLLRNASTAMHAAKQDAQHRIRFYDHAMSAAINHKVMIESELRRAIHQGELQVYYQAKVDLRSLEIVGAEALLRWMHPTRGLIAPLAFIPIAEETGLIEPITLWVIEEVCRQLAAWRAEGLRAAPVSINLDASSLRNRDLVTAVEQALAQNSLPASVLEFEVTESSLMRDMDEACKTLQALRNIGVKLSIDDFGTGYSSLTYLKRFPVDTLKIDRSFIQDLPANQSDKALTMAIIAMAHNLNLDLIAEGVETWEQVAFLVDRQCFFAQGFLFAKPLPADDFAKLAPIGAEKRTA